jgi:hypothetical protein
MSQTIYQIENELGLKKNQINLSKHRNPDKYKAALSYHKDQKISVMMYLEDVESSINKVIEIFQTMDKKEYYTMTKDMYKYIHQSRISVEKGIYKIYENFYSVNYRLFVHLKKIIARYQIYMGDAA